MQTLLWPGVLQEAGALVEQISKITKRDKVFDVDMRWEWPLMNGNQSLEQITESTQRGSSGCAREKDV